MRTHRNSNTEILEQKFVSSYEIKSTNLYSFGYKTGIQPHIRWPKSVVLLLLCCFISTNDSERPIDPSSLDLDFLELFWFGGK